MMKGSDTYSFGNVLVDPKGVAERFDSLIV
jgi:hypothetical protein